MTEYGAFLALGQCLVFHPDTRRPAFRPDTQHPTSRPASDTAPAPGISCQHPTPAAPHSVPNSRPASGTPGIPAPRRRLVPRHASAPHSARHPTPGTAQAGAGCRRKGMKRGKRERRVPRTMRKALNAGSEGGWTKKKPSGYCIFKYIPYICTTKNGLCRAWYRRIRSSAGRAQHF